MDSDSDTGNRYSTKLPNAVRWLLLFLAFLISNTCQDAPRKNPLDPENPESDVVVPPIVTDFEQLQVNMGFELSWTKVDSTIPNIAGYKIVRSDSVLDQTVDFEQCHLIDTDFNPSDSGEVFYYEISTLIESISQDKNLQGSPKTSTARRLIAKPIEISIDIKETIPGFTDTNVVEIEITEIEGEPESIMSSESPSFAGSEWEVYSNPYTYELFEIDGLTKDGLKKVYIKCMDVISQVSNVAIDSIILDTSPPTNLSVEIIPVNNSLYQEQEYQLEVSGFTPSLNVKLLLTATDSTRWKACLNNESATFPDNPECTSFTNGDSLEKVWTLASGTNEPRVSARFEDELGHRETDNIRSAWIEFDDIPPDENASVSINDNDLETESDIVTLRFSNDDKNIFQMNISNTRNIDDEDWQECVPPITIQYWPLEPGNGYDIRSVYVQFRDKAGNVSDDYSDDIILNPTPSAPEGLEIEAVSNGTIKILWVANTENDIGKYVIYRSTSTTGPDSVGYTTLNHFTDTGLTNGKEYQYQVTVVDTTGKESQPSSPSPWVEPENTPPTVRLTFNPSTGTRKTFFTFDASASTDDVTPSQNLEARWDFGGDEVWDKNFSIENLVVDSVTFSETGDIQIICEVRDDDISQRAVGSKDTSLHINIPPDKPSISAPGGPYYRNTDVCLTALGNDPDGDAISLKCRWIISGDTLEWGEAGNAQICFQSDSLGFVSAKVQCKDAWEEVSEWSNTVTIEIENKPPIAGFTILPDSVGRRDDVFEFCATSDRTSDEHTSYNELIIQWKFIAEGDWTTPDTVKCITHSYSGEASFVFDVSLRVIDSDGASTITTRHVRINRPPDQPTLSATPTTTYKREPVTFTVTASDPDNDELEYFFDFGDSDSSGWTPLDEVPHAYDNSGSFQARGIVQDVWGDSSAWSSPPVSITVNNKTPNIPSSPTYTPSPLYKNTSLTVTATLSDPDGDDVKLCAQWGDGTSSCGSFVPSGSSGSVINGDGYSSSGTKSISLSTKDVEDAESSPTSLSISVLNRAPNNPEISGLPSTGYTCESVSFDARASDQDGDQVQLTVQWGDGQSDSSPLINSGQWYGFSHTYYSTTTKNITAYAEDIEGAKSGNTNRSISIYQRPPDINSPSSITITYPSSSGTSQAENIASSCAQTLVIGSVSDNVAWLTTSVNRTSLSPGQTATLTANVSSWSSFSYGETKYATITINSNDPDEPSKTVSVTAKMTYPVCNMLFTTSWGSVDVSTNNPNGKGSVDLTNVYYGDDPCNSGQTAIKITDVNGSFGSLEWTVRGKAPDGTIRFYIEDRKAEDNGIGASEIYWEFWFDGGRKYYGTYDESDGCTPFNRTIYGSFTNEANHTFEIRVYDQTLGSESLWFSKLRIEWCGWFVNQSNSNCTGCN